MFEFEFLYAETVTNSVPAPHVDFRLQDQYPFKIKASGINMVIDTKEEFFLYDWDLTMKYISLVTLSFIFQNDSNSTGAGGPVKITENRSKKTSFFRCSLL